MTLYKLNNTIIKKIQNQKDVKISRPKYSIGLFKSLMQDYYIHGTYEYHYCCEGEDHNCWVDVEGLDFGWLFLDYPEEQMPEVLYNRFMKMIKKHRIYLYRRKLFYMETKDSISILVPLRDICKTDYLIVFAKEKDSCVDIF